MLLVLGLVLVLVLVLRVLVLVLFLLLLTPSPPAVLPVMFRPFVALPCPLVEAASAASFKRLRDMHCKKLPLPTAATPTGG